MKLEKDEELDEQEEIVVDLKSSPQSSEIIEINKPIEKKIDNGSLIPIISSLAYSISAILMILTNKILMTSYGWKYSGALFLFQNSCSFLMVGFLKFGGWIQVTDLKFDLIVQWIPVNLLFCLMLISNLKW